MKWRAEDLEKYTYPNPQQTKMSDVSSGQSDFLLLPKLPNNFNKTGFEHYLKLSFSFTWWEIHIIRGFLDWGRLQEASYLLGLWYVFHQLARDTTTAQGHHEFCLKIVCRVCVCLNMNWFSALKNWRFHWRRCELGSIWQPWTRTAFSIPVSWAGVCPLDGATSPICSSPQLAWFPYLCYLQSLHMHLSLLPLL